MGESFVISSQHAAQHTNHVLPQPTPSLVTEDDDEPPSSGSHPNRQTQVEHQANAGVSSYDADDGVYNHSQMVADRDDKVNTNIVTSPVVNIQIVDRTDTLVEKDIEQGIIKNNSTSRGTKKPYTTFFGVRFKPGKRSTKLRTLFTPTKPLGPTPSYVESCKSALRYSPLNILLLFIPVSWALHYTHQSPTLVFIFSALAIIPLAALLGFGTEQIALRTSASVGGLMNATLGNIIEMIIAGVALKQCELELVQSSLLGGLLSNLLLVLGMAFIVGGYRFHQQEFQPMVAQLNSSLLIVSVISLITPVAFHAYLEDRLAPGTELPILLQLSRGSAIILMFIYFAYLYFQFYSHNHLFLELETSTMSSKSSDSSYSDSMSTVSSDSSDSSNSSEFHTVRLNTIIALLLVVGATGLAYPTAENLVDSLEGLLEAHPNVSKEWITLIIIPVISNAAEHVTAVIVASKGKFDLAMSVAVGSCIQIALFVIPVLTLVAWGMGKPLTLLFDPLETIVLFFSVLLVKFSVEDGKAHWMSGLALVAVYILIALSFWNFPVAHRLIQDVPISCGI